MKTRTHISHIMSSGTNKNRNRIKLKLKTQRLSSSYN